MIAVHAGAGYHSPALEAAYKRGDGGLRGFPQGACACTCSLDNLCFTIRRSLCLCCVCVADLAGACRAGAAALAGGGDALAAVAAAIQVLEVCCRCCTPSYICTD